MFNDETIRKAVEILNQGGIIVYPTDTAYGIGCRMDKEESIKRIFKIKNRPFAIGFPNLVESIPMAKTYFSDPPEDIEGLMEKYWPGGLTIVYWGKERDPLSSWEGKNLIGLRMPNHPIALGLIKGVGIPLVGTSANFHGEPTPYKHEDLNPKLLKMVDYVMEGSCTVCKESTVIDCTQKPWKIKRQGAVEVMERGEG